MAALIPDTRAIVRKLIGLVPMDTLDLVALASVHVTSEQDLFPIDNAFDGLVGPGGSCWVAAKPGPQTVHLRFAVPTDLDRLVIESEERSVRCTQRIDVACWGEASGGRVETPHRVLDYAPYGPSFHRETWDLAQRAVSDIWITVTPGSPSYLATLTAVACRR